MKNRIAQLLLLLLLAAAAASCGGETVREDAAAGSTDTAVSDSEAAVPASALERLETADYGGHTFRILATNDNNRQQDVETVGGENGEIFNDLVYARNRAVEEKYNITIEGSGTEYSEVVDTIRLQVSGGLTDYDLYFGSAHAAKLAAEGYLADLYTVEGLDLTSPWWSTAATESLSVGGRLYVATGDINPTTLMSAGALVFNKQLFTDSDIAYPYQTVRDGKWTIDEMIALCAELSADLNGDGKMTYGDDRYALSSWCAAGPYAFYYSMGGMMTVKGDDDIPALHWDTEQLTSMYDKMYELIIGQKSYYVTDVALYDTNFKCFSDGYAYFNQVSLLTLDRNLRDMEDDYGILPMPKYDEAQESYLSYVNPACTLTMIPANPADETRTGLITQALAAGAYDSITPSLYDVITKSRNVRDEESAEMVGIITDRIVFDPFYFYMLDGSSILQNSLNTQTENITSVLESKRKAAEASLEKLIEAYRSME